MDLGRQCDPLPVTVPFVRPAHMLPYAAGRQFITLGIGGPQGIPNGTVQARPWPYQTETRRFIQGGPYGFASTLLQPRSWPYLTLSTKFVPTGYWKAPTGTGIVF